MRKFGALVAVLVVFMALAGFVNASNYKITVDGDPSDWTGDSSLLSDNSYTISNGEWIWKDATGDERTDFSNPDPRVDITEFRITADDTYIYFLIKFKDLDVVGDNGAPGIMITIDTDQVQGSGQTWFGFNSDTQVAQGGKANWEYQLLINLANDTVKDGSPVYGDGKAVWRGGSPLDLVDTNWNDVSSPDDMFVASTANDAVEVRIKKSELGNPSTIRVELAVVRVDPSGNAWDINGASDVLDAMTTTGPNTWNEVQDGHIDYYADIDISQVPFFSSLAVGLAVALGALLVFRRL
ncbi:glucodextranase DOMON-like domain-containing protein [Thermococcus zilligii]|uniref:glucodextranase DOMON-like domain-containing protein n=1 Tax=Thermococcus zilligii TaxID=54076 RepID=UPI00029A2CDC|nr:glucodextranase DOMON-like domain-containing protein [Thermococcus zilligii]